MDQEKDSVEFRARPALAEFPRVLAALLFVSFSLRAAPVSSVTPTDRPPDRGGYTRSIGIPPLFKTTAGLESVSYHTSTDHELGALLTLGVMRFCQVELRRWLHGGWSWVPYVLGVALSGAATYMSLRKIKGGSSS